MEMENKNERVEQVERETIKMEETRKQPEVLGFWFGVGAALGTKMVNNLEELISR